MLRFLVIITLPIRLRRLAGTFQIRVGTVNQKIFVKFMAAAKNQFNRIVAGQIDNCCRIQINADVLDRRGLVLEDVATAPDVCRQTYRTGA